MNTAYKSFFHTFAFLGHSKQEGQLSCLVKSCHVKHWEKSLAVNMYIDINSWIC